MAFFRRHVACVEKTPAVQVDGPADAVPDNNSTDLEMTASSSAAPADTEADPFSSNIKGGVNYKSMNWVQGGLLMVAETISLGILALPQVLGVVGLIPGVLMLIVLGALATYAGYVIGQFRWKHPSVHSMADAAYIIGGRWLKEITFYGQLLFYIFIMGAHLLTFGRAMHALTGHRHCTIMWTAIGLLISFFFTIPRTLGNLSYYCVASFASIAGAVLITMIGAGVTKPGADASGHLQFHLFPPPETTFRMAVMQSTQIAFAYAGHVAFFTFISELKDPREFPKSLALLQTSATSMYIIVSIVCYVFAGSHIASPAVESLSPVLTKVAYGVALPTIIIAGVVNGHVAVKVLYVRFLKDNKNDLMHQKSIKSRGIWVIIGLLGWILAWVIAESIPVFGQLVGLTGALFASWFTYGFSALFWFHMNTKRDGGRLVWDSPTSKGRWSLAQVNGWSLVVAVFLCFVGLWAFGAGLGIAASFGNKPFQC